MFVCFVNTSSRELSIWDLSFAYGAALFYLPNEAREVDGSKHCLQTIVVEKQRQGVTTWSASIDCFGGWRVKLPNSRVDACAVF